MEPETFDAEALNFPELTAEPTGNDTQEVKVETPVEAPKESIPEPVTKTEEKSVEAPQDPATPEIKISDPPSQYDGESDLQYNIRKQIYDAGQAKAQAETPEEKSALTNHIKGLRKELALNHKSSDATPAPEKIEASQSQEASTEEEQAKEALRKMGYLPTDDIAKMVQDIIAGQSKQSEHLTAAKEFYATHKDIAADPARQAALENLVVERFKITPESSRQDLLIAMDMARNYLFPKTDNRAQRAAQSADKRDLVSFSSNTQSAPSVSKTDEKLSSSMKEAGLDMKEFGW